MVEGEAEVGSGAGVVLLCGGKAIGFALALGQQLAVEHAGEGGGAAGAVHGHWVFEVHQVVVGLAHARLLALVAPAEEQLGTLLQ